MNASELPADALGPLPRDDGGPVFAEPWQAEAFAITVKLAEAGHFTWPEWAQVFSAELASARERRPNDPASYYSHWLDALERLLQAKGLTDAHRLAGLKTAWAEAYAHTPHGQPVRLSNG